MITTDALKYLPQMGLDPSWVVGCVETKCQNSLDNRGLRLRRHFSGRFATRLGGKTRTVIRRKRSRRSAR